MGYLIETCGESYCPIDRRTRHRDWEPLAAPLPGTLREAAELAMTEADTGRLTSHYRCVEIDRERGICRDATEDLHDAIYDTPDPYADIGLLRVIAHSRADFGLERIYPRRPNTSHSHSHEART